MSLNIEASSSPEPMSEFDRLNPVWDNILSFLTAPLPRPLSGETQEDSALKEGDDIARLPRIDASDGTRRGEIYRADLATLMRTSTQFNRLASTHLYRTIITSEFISLTSHLDSPSAHPSIPSKLELLQKCRSLHIEYQKPGDESTYPELMANPKLWKPLTEPVDLIWVTTQSIIKLEALHSHLLGLIRRPDALFPRLHILTMGCVFGGQAKTWFSVSAIGSNPKPGVPDTMASAKQTISMEMASMGISTGLVSKRIDGCSRMLEIIFRHSPLEHYCQRGNIGPLSLPALFHWGGKSADSPRPIHTIHFESQAQSLPAAIGYPTRWVLEQHERTTVLPQLVNQVNHLVKATKHERMQQGLPADGYELEIYSSSNRYADPGRRGESAPVSIIDPKQERDGVVSLSKSMLASTAHRNRAPTTDKISWRALIDAPECKACGWVYEEGGSKDADKS